jgi:hypothetical protein
MNPQNPAVKSGSLGERGHFVAGRILGRIGPERLVLRARASRHWIVVVFICGTLAAFGFGGSTRFGSSEGARVVIGLGSLGLGLVCLALAFGSDKLTLDRVRNIMAYRANGGYAVHKLSVDHTSLPEVRSRKYHMKGREHTAHYLYFNGLEDTTFVFDHHSPDDLKAAATVIGEFLKGAEHTG